MATGDAAAAAGMDLVAGSAAANTLDTEGNKTRDYVAGFGIKPGTALPVARGGTGGTSAAAARTNLNVPAWTDVAPAGTVFNNQIARFGPTGKLQVTTPTAPFDVATKGYVDAAGGGTTGTDLTLSGHLYVPASSAAASGYTIAYIDGPTGRLSRGASARKYKEDITAAPELGDLFACEFVEYQMIDGDGTRILGYIADDLAENPDLERFVVYAMAPSADGDMVRSDVVESIDFIQLLLAQNAQLHARLAALEISLDVKL